MLPGSGFSQTLTFASRFENGSGTNPEELIGAALSGCFSMAFSLMLGEAGYTPEHIESQANVTIEQQGEGFAITRIGLSTYGTVPGIDAATFEETARAAKEGCPVSKALAGTTIELEKAELR